MKETKDSGVEWIGEIPKDWEILSLSRVLTEHSRKNAGNIEQNVLSLSYGNIIRRDVTDNMGLIPESFETYNIIEPGQIVLRLTDLQNDQRSLRTGLVKERGIITSAYLTLTSKIEIDSRYYHYLLHTYDVMKIIYNMGNGVRQNLKFSELAKLPLPIPAIKEQHHIADYLDAKCAQIDRAIARQQEVIEKLKAYKLSVITEAVTKGLNPDVPMKDSGIEWIGEIPEHWGIQAIGKVAKVTSSTRVFEEDYTDEGLPFFRSKEIVDLSKGAPIVTELYVSQDTFKRVCTKSPAPAKGDMLITSIGTIGQTWISDGREFYYKDGNITQIVQNDRFNMLFLKFCFTSNVIFEQYNRLAMGSTLLALTIVKIKRLIFPFPPLEEQRKISQFLGIQCDKIERAINKKQIIVNRLTEYKKSLIYEVVTGKRKV